jgi:hypothetical protein
MITYKLTLQSEPKSRELGTTSGPSNVNSKTSISSSPVQYHCSYKCRRSDVHSIYSTRGPVSNRYSKKRPRGFSKVTREWTESYSALPCTEARTQRLLSRSDMHSIRHMFYTGKNPNANSQNCVLSGSR